MSPLIDIDRINNPIWSMPNYIIYNFQLIHETSYHFFRTRWNTLFDMLIRFLILEEIINSTLIQLKLRSLILTEEELQSVKDLVEALKPIEKGSRKLCSRKTTLGKADKILEIMLGKLYKLTTPIGQQLFSSVESRVKDRRNKTAATLQAFLEDHEFLEEIEQGDMKMLDYTERKELIESACFLYKRLFASNTPMTSAKDTTQDSRESEMEIVDVDPDDPGMYSGGLINEVRG